MTPDTPWTPRTRKGGQFYQRTCSNVLCRVYWCNNIGKWMAWVNNKDIGLFYSSTHAKRAATKAAKDSKS